MKVDETPSNVLIGTRRLFATKTRDCFKPLIILPYANHRGNPRTLLFTVYTIMKPLLGKAVALKMLVVLLSKQQAMH